MHSLLIKLYVLQCLLEELGGWSSFGVYFIGGFIVCIISRAAFDSVWLHSLLTKLHSLLVKDL